MVINEKLLTLIEQIVIPREDVHTNYQFLTKYSYF